MTAQYPAAYKYVQAKGYTDGRPDGPPLWIVIHTMEAHELDTTAEGTANYFRDLPDDRQVSAHLCIDNNSAIQCVDVNDSAWTVGNRPGNRRGLNYEHAGYAEQTAEQWADAYSTAMLRLSAKCAVSDVRRFGIPVRRCTVDQLKAYQPGFTTHNDLRLAFGATTHTDPGPAYPWSRYLDLVREEMGEHVALTNDDAKTIWNADIIPAPEGSKEGDGTPNVNWSPASYLHWGYKLQVQAAAAANAALAALKQLAAQDNVDEAAIAAAVAPIVAQAVLAALPQDIESMTSDELGQAIQAGVQSGMRAVFADAAA